MSYSKMQPILLFIISPFLFAGGCNLFEDEQVVDTTGTIFGSWELVEIQFDNGETLKPSEANLYWIELSKDSVFAEDEFHYSLSGRNNCNNCFGYFDVDTLNKHINISFICNRLICGISTEFSSTISTSYKYKFKESTLILTFEYPTNDISPNSGKVVLSPKQ